MLHYLCDNHFPFVVVLTKIDKLKTKEREKNLAMLKEEMSFIGEVPMIPFSAENGEGCDVIRSLLDEINEEGNLE